MGGAGLVLGQQGLGHLRGRAEGEAIRGETPQLVFRFRGGIDRDAREPPGQIRGVLLEQERRGTANRRVLVGRAHDFEQAADVLARR